MPLENMIEDEQKKLIEMGLFLKNKMIEAGLPPYDYSESSTIISNGPLQGIPIYQSVHVPVDAIVIHPFVMFKIISYGGPGQVIDIKKGK